jgi:hypothetical protein
MPTYYLSYDGTTGQQSGIYATYSYIDGSLLRRDSYIDSSLLKRDLSINDLYLKVGEGYAASQVYTDGSFGLRDISIAWLNTNKLESSALYPYATNASISLIDIVKGVSLNDYATNASVNLALTNYVKNSSLSEFIKESSLGPAFHWNASTSGSLLDVLPLTTLYDLSDVSIQFSVIGSRDDRVLTYDGSTNLWHDRILPLNSYFKLDKLTDTSILSPANYDVLQYDLGITRWKNNDTTNILDVAIDISTIYYDINAMDNKIATINTDISTLQAQSFINTTTWYVLQENTIIPSPMIGRVLALKNLNFYTYSDISVWCLDTNMTFDSVPTFTYLTIPYRESVFLYGCHAAPHDFWLIF